MNEQLINIKTFIIFLFNTQCPGYSKTAAAPMPVPIHIDTTPYALKQGKMSQDRHTVYQVLIASDLKLRPLRPFIAILKLSQRAFHRHLNCENRTIIEEVRAINVPPTFQSGIGSPGVAILKLSQVAQKGKFVIILYINL